MEVTVRDILLARDRRAARQQAMLREHGLPLISLTMNIAGSVKLDDAIRRAFDEGVSRIEAQLAALRCPVRAREATVAFTGCEQLWAVDGDPAALKLRACAVEEQDALGRLFDIDVLAPDGRKLERQTPRRCLLCGEPAFVCARSRAHSAEALSAEAHRIIGEYFRRETAEAIAEAAQRALLREAVTTPKPGLVDRRNNGAHRDMDLFTFMDSAAALRPYFFRCALTGADTAALPPEEVFPLLRCLGAEAERTMLDATGGINTHKGAIFALGLLCAAAGRVNRLGTPAEKTDAILAECAALAAPSLRDFSADRAETGGERQYRDYGLTGARGEAAGGFPSVREHGLPALRAALAEGQSPEAAGLRALAALLAAVPDSNVIRRGGLEAAEALRRAAAALPRDETLPEALAALDERLIEVSLSPGGCADLLAVCWFLILLP